MFKKILKPFKRSYKYNNMILGATSYKSDQLIDRYYSPRPKAIGGLAAGNLNKDINQVQRLITAYQLALSEPKNLGNAMWLEFFYRKHKNTHEIFLKGDLKLAADLLHNPGSTNMFYGFDNFCDELVPSILSDLDSYADGVLLKLIWLLEALGSLRIYNPEGPPPYRKIPTDIDQLLKLLDSHFENPISFPNPFPGECGLLTSRGIITPRDIQSIYQAWRIKQLVKNTPNPRIMEIGAGLGRTAYYAKQLGILDYTIVDLPFTCLSSGHFLIQTLGPDNVLLIGENVPEDSNQLAKVFSPSFFLDESHYFDLILNADSLTEMDREGACSYLNKIGASTKKFLSINHELNGFTVQELIHTDKRVVSVDRKPYWMRVGYVEELIHFQ